MIERVARAIARKHAETLDWAGYLEGGADQYVDQAWSGNADYARAAIESMRPTTNEMDVAGAVYLRAHPSDASGCFTAMIDAAISEQPK